MDDERDKPDRPADEDDDVEGHKFVPDELQREKFAESADDEDDEVEAHKF
jgi:hypothetical protein